MNPLPVLSPSGFPSKIPGSETWDLEFGVDDPAPSTEQKNPGEGSTAARAARLLYQAIKLFNGDVEAAAEWLLEPQPALDGEKPLNLSQSEVGTQQVTTLIFQLLHGVYV